MPKRNAEPEIPLIRVVAASHPSVLDRHVRTTGVVRKLREKPTPVNRD
jgi:hypothetical protein